MRLLLVVTVGLALFAVGIAVTIARMQADGWTVLAAVGAGVFAWAVAAVKREAGK